jgi:hypothetical protein
MAVRRCVRCVDLHQRAVELVRVSGCVCGTVCVVRAVRCGCGWAESRLSSQPARLPACLPARQPAMQFSKCARTHTAAPRPSERNERQVRLAGWLAGSLFLVRSASPWLRALPRGVGCLGRPGAAEQPLSRFGPSLPSCSIGPHHRFSSCLLIPAVCLPLGPLEQSSNTGRSSRRSHHPSNARGSFVASYAQQHSTGILQTPPRQRVDRSLPASSLAVTRILHPQVLDTIRSSRPSASVIPS